MKPQEYSQLFNPSLSSVEDVIRAMQKVEAELKNTSFHNVIAFNHTYLIITQNVFKKIGTGYFTHDSEMQKFDINFAEYYFTAAKSYGAGKKTPAAWKILFDACKHEKLYQFVYMALGVNAHVNNDLALSLFDTISDDDFKGDFDKVNTVIDTSLDEVVLSLQEKSQTLNLLKGNFKRIYAYFLNHVICKWRKNAWNNYLLLKKGDITREQIEEKAEDIAKKIVKVKKFHHIHQFKGLL